MKESILKRYPELTEHDVILIGDDSGEIVVFGKWNSEKPIPTIEQVNQWVEEDAQLPKPLTTEERLAEAENILNLILLGGI
jgi:hypothetical protein